MIFSMSQALPSKKTGSGAEAGRGGCPEEGRKAEEERGGAGGLLAEAIHVPCDFKELT